MPHKVRFKSRWPILRCQTVQDGATVVYDFDRDLAVLHQYQPKHYLFCNSCSWIKHNSYTRNQVLRPTWVCMQVTAGPFPRADAAWTQPQDRSRRHCVASAREGSMLKGNWTAKMGGLGGEAFLRPFLHWQCSLAPYCGVDCLNELRSSKMWLCCN
jgi:hypothetical protein